MKHGIVIPCFNNAEDLKLEAFKEFIQSRPNFHLCFVNDGSTDDTLGKITLFSKLFPERVHICNIFSRSGEAVAFRYGASFLFRNTKVDTIGFLNAELSIQLRDYEELILEMEWDPFLKVVNGTSIGDDEKQPITKFWHKFIAPIQNGLFRFALGLPINPNRNNTRVFVREVIPILFNTNFTSRMLFDLEMLLRLKKHLGVRKFLGSFQEVQLPSSYSMDDTENSLWEIVSKIPYLVSVWFNYSIIDRIKFTMSSKRDRNYSLINI